MASNNPVEKLNKIHEQLWNEKITEDIAKEGRTGLMKARKIMAIDLRRKKSSIKFSYDENKKFVVTIKMERDGLTI